MLQKSELWILWEANSYIASCVAVPTSWKWGSLWAELGQFHTQNQTTEKQLGPASLGHGAKEQLHHCTVGRWRSDRIWGGVLDKSLCFLLSLLCMSLEYEKENNRETFCIIKSHLTINNTNILPMGRQFCFWNKRTFRQLTSFFIIVVSDARALWNVGKMF